MSEGDSAQIDAASSKAEHQLRSRSDGQVQQDASERRPSIRVLSLPGRRFPQNPYLRLFCDALEDAGVRVIDLRSTDALLFRYDIVHVHFPEHYVSAQTLSRACFWMTFYAVYFVAAKLLRRRIVWMVHNVLPFQNRHSWLLGPWMRLFRQLADAHVFLSRSSRAEFAERFPRLVGKPACVVPHGAYRVPPPDPRQQAEWRARVAPAEPAFLVGFLGNIKRYKNIGALAALPARLADGRRVHAVIAGTPDAESRADLEAVSRALGDRVALVRERVDDADLNDVIAAMDVVVLPYHKGWNSGFAMLVLGNRIKLITSNLPMFRELQEDVGPAWVATYPHESALGRVLEAFAQNGLDGAANRKLDTFLAANSFGAGAGRLATFYAFLVA